MNQIVFNIGDRIKIKGSYTYSKEFFGKSYKIIGNRGNRKYDILQDIYLDSSSNINGYVQDKILMADIDYIELDISYYRNKLIEGLLVY